MNTNWLKRNWLLAVVPGLIVLMLVKKLISKLPKIDSADATATLSNLDMDVSYIWIIVVAAIAAIALGNKTIKIVGLMAVLFSALIFAENLYNFNWNTLPIGRVVEEKFGPGSSKWLWIVPSIALIYFTSLALGSNVIRSLGNNILALIMIIAVVWSIMDATDMDEKLMKANNGGVTCLTQDEAAQTAFFEGSRDITICADRAINIIAANGTKLTFTFSPKFLAENEHLLTGLKPEDFVKIHKPGTFVGSTLHSYAVAPIRSNYRYGEKIVSTFDKKGLKYITLTVTGELL